MNDWNDKLIYLWLGSAFGMCFFGQVVRAAYEARCGEKLKPLSTNIFSLSKKLEGKEKIYYKLFLGMMVLTIFIFVLMFFAI